jgi:hypothetical protein
VNKNPMPDPLLSRPAFAWGQGNFSHYDLSRGTEFRKYCDAYAKFQKQMKPYGVICVNVDAISNPDKTWEIQRFFEKEHGVTPVPVVHYGTSMKYVDLYLNAGRYDLLGVGGLGQKIRKGQYLNWADELFLHLCPESNRRFPIIKTHGFAMTSWELICRYPWWSVDSATWVKLSAYGWLYIPKWSMKKGWRFDLPPIRINFSTLSKEKEEHFANVPKEMKWLAEKWLKHLRLKMGSVDAKGKMTEFGVL